MGLILNDSTAMHLGKIIDCRYLTLAIEFHNFSSLKTQSLVLDVLEWVNYQVDDNFVSSWKIDNHSVGMKGFYEKAKETMQNNSICFLGMDAYWKSEKIKTKQQLRQWQRFVQYETCLEGWPPRGWSIDFADYWNSHILPYAKDKEGLKQAVKQLFREKGRYAKGVCYDSDVECAVFLGSQKDGKNERQGRILLYVSAFALADGLVDVAEAWKKALINFAQKYGDLDGRVMLQPRVLAYSSPHMVYFDDGRKIPYGYLPGVEWANILSPKAQELLSWEGQDRPTEDAIECTPLPGGGLLFASRRNILEYDVDDALLLKSWIKEALYPGPGIGFPLSVIMRPARQQGEIMRMPRKDWAIVPILEEEIELWGSQLRFDSNTI